jgi:hypothetical protein
MTLPIIPTPAYPNNSLVKMAARAFVRETMPLNYDLHTSADTAGFSHNPQPLYRNDGIDLNDEALDRDKMASISPAISNAMQEVADERAAAFREIYLTRDRSGLRALNHVQLSLLIERDPGDREARMARRLPEDLNHLIEQNPGDREARMARRLPEDLNHLIEQNPRDREARMARLNSDDLSYLSEHDCYLVSASLILWRGAEKTSLP